MQTLVLYILNITSSHEKSGDIIIFAHLEEVNLVQYGSNVSEEDE